MSNKNPGRVEIYEDEAGEHRFRCVAGNGEILTDGYSSSSAAEKGYNDLRAFCYANPPIVRVGRDEKPPKKSKKAKGDPHPIDGEAGSD